MTYRWNRIHGRGKDQLYTYIHGRALIVHVRVPMDCLTLCLYITESKPITPQDRTTDSLRGWPGGTFGQADYTPILDWEESARARYNNICISCVYASRFQKS